MMRPNRRPSSLTAALTLGLVAAGLGAAASSRLQAGASSDGRVEVGVKVFRYMLAADEEIDKKVDPEGFLRVLILHEGDDERTRMVSDLLTGRDSRFPAPTIKGLVVRTESVRVEDLAKFGPRPVAAVFVAERLRRTAYPDLIRFGVDRRLIVYSPFEGDVEAGVAGGISIGAQVRPFVNQETLRAAQVTLRALFLKQVKVFP